MKPAMFIIDSAKPRPFTVDLTVVSAEGLDASAAPISSCFPFPRRRRLRPFASLTISPPDLYSPRGGGGFEYVTGPDTRGGENPTWGDSFRIPVGPDFLAKAYSCLHLCVYDARSGDPNGRRLLGWCQIPVWDFGAPPTGAARQLSYRLKDMEGTRTQGIVNVEVRVEGPLESDRTRRKDTCGAVIGIPVRIAI